MSTLRRLGGATPTPVSGPGLLARTGRALLNVTDPTVAYGAVRDSLVALCAATAGLGMLVLRREDASATVTLCAGLAPELLGARVSGAALPVYRAGDPLAPLGTVELAGLGPALPGADLLGAALGGGQVLLVIGAGPALDSPGAAAARDTTDALLALLALAEARCRAYADLIALTDHDPLTAIGNRTALVQRLQADVAGAAGTEARLGLLRVDLDDFKQVNDAFGEAAGDAVLVEIARRLTQAGGEAGLAARLGGDEFALLLTDLDSPEHAVAVAERLRDSLIGPIPWQGTELRVGVNIGVMIGAAGLTAADLMRSADIAMSSAQALGRNRVVRFRADRHGSVARLRGLADHLPDAIANDEIVLHYQPMIDLGSGRCIGVEALVRWQHPVLGTLAPSAFLPLAQREGHLVELGRHVLATACRQVMVWRAPRGLPELRLAVNISPQQLTVGVEALVAEALRASGLPAQRLTLELNETGLVDDQELLAALARLRDLGIRVALDDFGGGYAALAGLRAIGVHQVKIDRRLLHGDATVTDELVRMIMTMCQRDGLETVAEAIETDADADWARQYGFNLVQGFLFSRALPAPEMGQWLSGTGWRARQTSPGIRAGRATTPAR